jgi:hypothetical protein
MVRDPSKSIASTNGKKQKRRPLSPADAAAVDEWKGDAWKPHRATCCWQADLADFGIEKPLPSPAAKKKKK